jgi:hypothetical protein
MRVITLIVLIAISVFNANGQNSFDPQLKKQLDSVSRSDQKYRGILSNGISDSVKNDSLAKAFNIPAKNVIDHLWKLQNSIDSSNLVFVENIFLKYGYPGRSLVGAATCEAAWNVIQHSRKIDKYIGLIKNATTKKELPFKLYAMMYDRYLVAKKKKQIYGSQIVMLHLKNGKTDWYVWPIKDPVKVNKLRKKAGFDKSVEANAKSLDVDYSIIKMSDLKI